VLGQDPAGGHAGVARAGLFQKRTEGGCRRYRNRILNKPGGEYCFDANRIMVELLTGGDNPEELEIHRERVNQLDPYAALAPNSVFQAAAVSDAAVTLERLEYTGQRVELGSGWSPGSIDLSPSDPAKQPDWLQAAAPPLSEPAPEPAPSAGEEIPDFLRQAGWGESTGAADESASPFAVEETPASAEGELAPGDMPDWLKAMSPSMIETPQDAGPSMDAAGEMPDWLGGLAGTGTAASAKPAPTGKPPAPAEPAGDMPDWLGGLAGAGMKVEETPAPASEPHADVAPVDDTPDWLAGLTGAGMQMDESTAPAVEPPAAMPPADDTPDWLAGLAA
jgi:hypothetical protein